MEYVCPTNAIDSESKSIYPLRIAGSRLDLAIVLPTYKERENIPLIIDKLDDVLHGLAWEAIFVDDDSPDGTAEIVTAYARLDTRIRLLQRIGRRGLSSACLEGMLATSAPVVAVMDADLQHDEAILPVMLRRLHQESLDLVVGTRNADGGSMGEFGRLRRFLSRSGQKISYSVCRSRVTDPMSGFFLLRRSFLQEVVRDMQGQGFKILVDLLASSPRPVRLAEVGYTFRVRRFGESKLDVVVGLEYVFLILNNLLGGIIPVRLALYLLVGALGLATHLVTLLLLSQTAHLHFVAAQLIATFVAMIENFSLNNRITFRDRRLQGVQILSGGARFVLACGFGAWANVVFANSLWQSGTEWYLAGLAGIVLGSVWNLSISSLFTWGLRSRSRRDEPLNTAFADEVEVSR